jgi:ABC-2 type transport system permease protein
MKLERFLLLVRKEIVHGSRGFLVIAVATPVVISLLFSLVFGTLFAGLPRLGIADEGGSRMVAAAEALESVRVIRYSDAAALRTAVQRGAVDFGMVLPAGFDEAVAAGTNPSVSAWVWGESLAKDRLVLAAAVASLVRGLAGGASSVTVDTVLVGEGVFVPWSERLLPMVVLVAVFIGGMFLPAASLIEEKERRTLSGLLVTPATAGEVIASKGVVAGIVCFVMGMVVLAMNRAFGSHPGLVAGIIALGTVQAVAIGLMLGVVLKDLTTLFAFSKSGGIVIFAPTVVYLFPAIPAWIGRIFPTYYLLQPVIDISQRGAGWADVRFDAIILAAIDVGMIVLLALMLWRARQRTQTI